LFHMRAAQSSLCVREYRKPARGSAILISTQRVEFGAWGLSRVSEI
jgi:hypothetical protein